MTLLKRLFSRRWLSGTVLVLVAMGLFARLGIWQLDRLAERRAQNSLLQAVLESPPLDLAEPLPAAPEALENRLAVVSGQYDFAEERVLLLQTWQGRTGVQLVTPLLIGGGETAVLVNRGWIPQSEYEAGQQNQYQTDVGPVTLSGFLASGQQARGEANGGPELYRIDIEAIDTALSYELLPLYLVETPEEEFDLEPPFQVQREIDLSEGPHLGYAIQWFIFCVMTGLLYLVFVRRSESQTSAPVEPL